MTLSTPNYSEADTRAKLMELMTEDEANELLRSATGFGGRRGPGGGRDRGPGGGNPGGGGR